jgi:putative endonuclease
MKSPQPHTRAQWAAAEELAKQYLIRHDWSILGTNWFLRDGELDIIAYDGIAVVFIEVKSRTSTSRGAARESLSPLKQMRFRRSGLLWAHIHGLPEGTYRFDFIALQKQRESWRLEHYKNIEL